MLLPFFRRSTDGARGAAPGLCLRFPVQCPPNGNGACRVGKGSWTQKAIDLALSSSAGRVAVAAVVTVAVAVAVAAAVVSAHCPTSPLLPRLFPLQVLSPRPGACPPPLACTPPSRNPDPCKKHTRVQGWKVPHYDRIVCTTDTVTVVLAVAVVVTVAVAVAVAAAVVGGA